MKPVAIITITILAVGAGIYLLASDANHNQGINVVDESEQDQVIDENQNQDTTQIPINTGGDTPLNTSYIIDGQTTTLVEGKNEESIPNSSAKIITSVWGTPTPGDLNDNQVNDAAVILNQTSGGSGSFYYVAASINDNDLFYGTNAVLLGDRIAIQNYSIDEGIIIVNYAVRPGDASMNEDPSVGVTGKFKLDGTTLTEVN